MLDKPTYLRYCYDWSWRSWWSRWSHNTVPILSWFTLFQKHYRWKTHLLSTALHTHRFLRKKEIRTVSPEVLGHPSPLLDPAGDKRTQASMERMWQYAFYSFTESTTTKCRMISPRLSQPSSGASWFLLRPSERLVFSQHVWQSSERTRSTWAHNVLLVGDYFTKPFSHCTAVSHTWLLCPLPALTPQLTWDCPAHRAGQHRGVKWAVFRQVISELDQPLDTNHCAGDAVSFSGTRERKGARDKKRDFPAKKLCNPHGS